MESASQSLVFPASGKNYVADATLTVSDECHLATTNRRPSHSRSDTEVVPLCQEGGADF